jgi:hypothetical protein
MERQAEYGDRRIICPLYKAAAIMAPGRLGMSVACDGRNCGMWAMCQGVHDRLDEIRNTVRNTLR